MSVEAQLAVIRTKVDILIELTKSRGDNHELRIRELEINGAGQDHEMRVRALEAVVPDLITRKATIAFVLLACTAMTAVANFVALWLR